jgi:DcuC family C4-dicarboxylate transporter
MPITTFFIDYQLPLVLVTGGALLVSYFFVNKYQDKKTGPDQEVAAETANTLAAQAAAAPKAPWGYGLIPLAPLVLLLISGRVGLKIDTNSAMLAGLFVAMVVEFFRLASVGAVLRSLTTFWDGMGDIFKSVVTLIVAADLFAKGLIALGFIDSLIVVSQHAGLGGVGVGILMTVLIFLASILMGSGNAAFFAFGPLVPAIAGQLGVASVEIILPMTLAASMGRTVSPIAGVVVAASKLGHVTPLQVVRRNLIPFLIALLVMILFNFF